MKRVLALPLLLLAGQASAEEPGAFRSFGDWVVGCDNRLSCTAIGLASDDAPSFAYLKVARDAGAESGPLVSVAVLDETGAGGEIGLALSGGEALPVSSLRVGGQEASIVTAELGPVDHGAFIDALLPASSLDVRFDDETVAVSLDGISAALRYMDAVQGRGGGVTAIVAKGEAGADAVTRTPPPVTVRGEPLREVEEPGARPEGLGEPDEYCPEGMGDLVFEGESGARLWGVCVSAGAYNLSYDFSVVRDGAAHPADFGADGQGFGEDGSSTLVNPMLMEDGRTVIAFARGRGLGDCGAISEWAMEDGEPVRLLSSVMGECRGVSPDDWPVLYRAELSTE